MERHDLKKLLQAQMGDGLAVVVGSGLSCAEGLPGMSALSNMLSHQVPSKVGGSALAEWAALETLIASEGLEPALFGFDPSEELEAAITTSVGDYVAEEERKVLAEVAAGTRTLRLTRLIPHLLKPDAGIPIMTTNYDRLVEVGVEEAGLGVDTMFLGTFSGALDEAGAKWSFCRSAQLHGKSVRLRFRPRATVCKPHGSLDWYLRDGVPIRFFAEVGSLQRLIITPGRRKFRTGYDSPFDRQRERANRAIEAALRFLVVGYGFNDDHLETYLTPAIAKGKPALMITYELLPNALKIAESNPNVIAIDRNPGGSGSRIHVGGVPQELSDVDWWDLGKFVDGVLAP